jgi:hypothetical protein
MGRAGCSTHSRRTAQRIHRPECRRNHRKQHSNDGQQHGGRLRCAKRPDHRQSEYRHWSQCLSNTTDGVWNVAATKRFRKYGNGNVANGTTALYSNIAKQESTAIGHSAMFYADDTAVGSVTYNTAVGAYALQGSATAANNTGIGNTALGHSALMNNTSGIGNIGIGYAALTNNAAATTISVSAPVHAGEYFRPIEHRDR